MRIGFVGDLLIDRDDPHEIFSEVRQLLRAPDILFGNLESPYSDAPGIAVTAPAVIAPRLGNLEAYGPAGFRVLSMANNHIVDAGHEALLETRARLRSQGIATCGAGENLKDARRPAILEKDGLKIGVLAYASIFPHGYEARSTVPGLAPLRAHNHFHEGLPEYYAPGCIPRVETLPEPQDHQHLDEDLEALRGEVDLLVASFHWGDHFRPFVLTDHEKRTARFCIDRGADLVLGHHQHTLRGIEWYRGKPVFYGLGNFVFDHRLQMTEEIRAYCAAADPDSYAVFPREGWPLLPLHPETRMTLLGWAHIEGSYVSAIGFVPCRLRSDGRVSAVDPDSAEGLQVLDYIEQCNQSQKLNGKIIREGSPTLGGCRSVRIVPLD